MWSGIWMYPSVIYHLYSFIMIASQGFKSSISRFQMGFNQICSAPNMVRWNTHDDGTGFAHRLMPSFWAPFKATWWCRWIMIVNRHYCYWYRFFLNYLCWIQKQHFCWLREDLTGCNVFSLREKLQTSSVARPKQIQNRLKLSLVFWSLYCQSLRCFGGFLLYG